MSLNITPISRKSSRRRPTAIERAIEADRRAEFLPLGDDNERNSDEYPEQAFRRGYQQGVHAVVVALEEEKLLDSLTQRVLREFIGTCGRWRYGKRRLERHIVRDRAPKPDFTRLWRFA